VSSSQLEPVDASPSLKDKAYSAIKDAILSLRLEPGAAIVETTLAEQLGISKTPVRDALQELEREGFVTRAFFKGTYVTDVTMKDIREVFQLRAVLEGLAARIATPLFSDDELQAVAGHLEQARLALERGDLLRCSERGQKMHHAIRQKPDNERLAVIIGNLDDHLRRFRGLSDQISGRLNKSLVEHDRVLAALRQRDPDAAEQAMRDHLFSVLNDLEQTGMQRRDGQQNE
jgi:DNA-binding GntR family transcriptional regulator